MTAPRPTRRDEISDAFDKLDKDEALIEEVLAMTPEALEADLGPERVARARVRAEETRRHFEALAAALPTSTSTSTADGPIAAPTLGADASSPVLPPGPSGPSVASYERDEPAPGSGQPHVARAIAQQEPRGKVVPLRRVLPIWLIAAALAAAAVGGGVALGVFHKDAPAPEHPTPDQPYTAPVPQPPEDFRAAATTHRAEARALCDAQKWEECNERLAQAMREDPLGDKTPEVEALWNRILQHQIEEAKKRPPSDQDIKLAPHR